MEEEATRKAWWKRPVPAWVTLGVLLVGAAVSVGLLLQVMHLDDRIGKLRDQRSDLRDRVSGLRSEVEDTVEDLKEARDRADTAEERAREKAETALADQTAAVVEREAQASAREAAAAEREQVADALLNGARATSFGDGMYQVGRDIQPGRYHTEGSGRTCYYAKLGSDGEDILDNNNIDGPVTIEIQSPYFESSRCGTWIMVG